MNIVLLGSPGSGKGTQAERLDRSLHIRHLATGDLFRENAKRGTPLGRIAMEYMNRGALVPDKVTVDMLRDRLRDLDLMERGVLFDGFPRNLSQAKALDQLLEELGQCLDAVIYIEVSDEEVTRRLSGRLACRECDQSFHSVFKPFVSCPTGRCRSGEYLYQRTDDRPETVRKRLETFRKQTTPLVDFYRERGLLREVDGEGSVEEVSRRIRDIVESIVESQGLSSGREAAKPGRTR